MRSMAEAQLIPGAYFQVGGGLFNITTKGGTNQYHSSAFDYWANEAFNAATPYVNTNPRVRRNDFGFSIGGPIYIPRVYKGKDRSFFFYNREQFREKQVVNNISDTVPTLDYRTGNFAGALGAGVLNCPTCPPNPLGASIPNGAIFDPNTNQTAANGQIYRTQFPGNIIPVARFDRVAAKIQSLLPLSDTTSKINNFNPSFPTERITTNESVRIDHQFSAKIKIAGSFGTNATGAQFSTNLNGSEGLPGPLTATRGTFTQSYSWRINYDHTLSPTMLWHLGAGLVNYPFDDHAPYTAYDQVAELGLKGATVNGAAGGRFPTISGLRSTTLGGMQNMGPGVIGLSAQTVSRETIPTFNKSQTWVKSNHTFKFGAELRMNGWVSHILSNTNGAYVFSTATTSQPYLGTTTTGTATAGFGYASFLLGQVSQLTINYPADVRMGKEQWGLFATDNWKLTRKLTLDPGLRWDYSQAPTEQYGRLPNLDQALANPSAGGHPGAVVYEATCNCSFAKNYRAKELQRGTGGTISEVFNRDINKSLSILSRPLVGEINGTYKTPRWDGGRGMSGRVLSQVVRDWTIGAVMQYSSGTPIAAPTSNNNLATSLFRSTTFTRVPGQPLFLKDLDCHCIDPRKDLVYNPAAWTDALPGQFAGSAVYFDDYRSQRRPQESMSMGRVFQIREKMSLSMRMGFSNIFSRTQMNGPVGGSPATQTTCSAGAAGSAICNNPDTRGTLNGGVGFISVANVASPPRTGTAVRRFTF